MPALIVELDTIFLGGFALAAEVLADRLGKYGIRDNDPNRFVRTFYGRPLGPTLRKILPENVDAAHVERRLAATYTALLQQNAMAAKPQIRQLLRPLANAGIRLGIVTHLRRDTALELFEDIAREIAVVLDFSPVSVGVSEASWQAAMVELTSPVRHTVALVSCGASVRTAMQIGLRTAVVPDPMTAFEDCAGALFVCDQINRTLQTKLKAKLLP